MTSSPSGRCPALQHDPEGVGPSLRCHLVEGHAGPHDCAIRTVKVTDAVLSYLDHGSWRCGHPPNFYIVGDPLPEGTCPCGLVDELHAVGLHGLADEYDPRKATLVKDFADFQSKFGRTEADR